MTTRNKYVLASNYSGAPGGFPLTVKVQAGRYQLTIEASAYGGSTIVLQIKGDNGGWLTVYSRPSAIDSFAGLFSNGSMVCDLPEGEYRMTSGAVVANVYASLSPIR